MSNELETQLKRTAKQIFIVQVSYQILLSNEVLIFFFDFCSLSTKCEFCAFNNLCCLCDICDVAIKI